MGVINKTTEKINELLDKIEDAPDKIENGKTPVFVAGTTTTLAPGMSATAEVVLVGTDPDGNPQYKINIGVPKGHDGTGGSGGGVADSVQWANVLNKPGWVNSATKPTYTASEVGALPEGTKIPTKTSDLTNDKGFLTSSGFKTINGESIVGTGNITIQGDGGSSGGTGNVNVTNASSLKKTEYYAYKPSADGSLNGTFSVIPNATESSNGLFSYEDYAKLSKIKSIISLPIAFADVTSKTTQDELLQLFKTALGEGSYINTFADVVTFLAYNGLAFQGEFLPDIPYKWFIGNYECLYYGNFIEEEEKVLAEFSFISYSGILKTIQITITGANEKYNLSINIVESGDDVFYLPYNVYDLNARATGAEITAAFGGEEGISAMKEAMKAQKEIRLIYAPNSAVLSRNINVSYESILSAAVWAISFECGLRTDNDGIKIISKSDVKVIYNSGYALKEKLYSLTAESSSDDISVAVGGEDGLKEIIKAVKDGNSFFIKGAIGGDMKAKTQVLPNIYAENENGNLGIIFAGLGYMLWGGLGGLLSIDYTKASNTFTCSTTPIVGGE